MIRGEDHLSNTPKHILLFRALGYPEPRFAHLPLILNPDRTKMSKRKSQTALSDYIAQGFIREALVNYLAAARLGDRHRGGGPVARRDRRAVRPRGRPQGRRRLRPRAARVAQRPVDPPARAGRPDRAPAAVRRGRAGGRPDRPDPVRRRAPRAPAGRPRAAADARRDRRPGRLPVGATGRRWIRRSSSPSAGTPATTRDGLTAARSTIAAVGEVTFEADELEPPLRALAEARGWKAGDLFMAIRVAVTGRTATPPLFDTMVALGRDRVLERLDRAVALLRRPDAGFAGASAASPNVAPRSGARPRRSKGSPGQSQGRPARLVARGPLGRSAGHGCRLDEPIHARVRCRLGACSRSVGSPQRLGAHV